MELDSKTLKNIFKNISIRKDKEESYKEAAVFF